MPEINEVCPLFTYLNVKILILDQKYIRCSRQNLILQPLNGGAAFGRDFWLIHDLLHMKRVALYIHNYMYICMYVGRDKQQLRLKGIINNVFFVVKLILVKAFLACIREKKVK